PFKSPGVARTEREPQRGMGDLADFLRNSEPPTPVPEELFRGNGSRGEDGGGAEDKDKERGGGMWWRLKGRKKGVK
ncbi:MAG: hypothetical protein Q9196_006731, partial [Gyalolechia fulgens]